MNTELISAFIEEIECEIKEGREIESLSLLIKYRDELVKSIDNDKKFAKAVSINLDDQINDSKKAIEIINSHLKRWGFDKHIVS